MTCVHLRKLYQLCEENQLKLSSSDLIHFVCLQCGRQEVCPSTLTDEYEARRTTGRTRRRSKKPPAPPLPKTPEAPDS